MAASRKIIRWENVKGVRATACVAVATALGAGLTPIAPGTMGSLMALPFAYLGAELPWTVRAAVWLLVFVVGVWSAKVFDEIMGSSDNQSIVIDEVLGLWLTAATAGRDPKTLLAAFVLFRFFDIVKPPPVRQLDRWSKRKASDRKNPLSAWYGGFGVIADDVVAGIQGLIIILVLQHYGILA